MFPQQNSLKAVLTTVFSMVNQLKIFDTVVASVAILMMHIEAVRYGMAKMIFHNQAMHEASIASVVIGHRGNRQRLLVTLEASTRAVDGTLPPRSPFKCGMAKRALVGLPLHLSDAISGLAIVVKARPRTEFGVWSHIPMIAREFFAAVFAFNLNNHLFSNISVVNREGSTA